MYDSYSIIAVSTSHFSAKNVQIMSSSIVEHMEQPRSSCLTKNYCVHAYSNRLLHTPKDQLTVVKYLKKAAVQSRSKT